MTTDSSWRPIGRVPIPELADARLQAHNAAQWLARAARAFVPAKSDDSHTSLTWDAAQSALVGSPVASGLSLGLDIANLRLLALGADSLPRMTFDLHGKNDAQAGNWLEGLLYKAGLDPDALDEALPWTMPDHPVGMGAPYDWKPRKNAFAELSNWYANAAQVLEDLRVRHAHIRPGPSPVRCWPHHFDIAILISLTEGDPEHAKSIGAGLSPGDDTYAEPYFYVSPWPYPDAGSLPDLPPPGQWHTKGFTAGIATASDILKSGDSRASMHDFASGAVARLIGTVT